MNAEKNEQILIIGKLLLIVACASLYAWGGMEMKFLRRFIAPTLAGAGAFFLSGMRPLELLKAPLLGIASSIGYGADTLLLSIGKRFYVGAAFGICSGVTSFFQQNWVLATWCVGSCIAAFIIFGSFNPFGSARIEETFLGLIIYANAILPVKRKEVA